MRNHLSFRDGSRVWAAAVGAAALAVLALGVRIAVAHDLFLKPEEFFLSPNAELRMRVLNGTFRSSEAPVARNRLRDLSLAGPTGVTRGDTTQWATRDKESRWQLRVGEKGTYAAGASVLPRVLRLEAKDFNAYLGEDGIADVLAERRRAHELDRPARERYSKHVKAIVSVGQSSASAADSAFRSAFGYPAELVPLDNPYALRVGSTLRVRALVDGTPVSSQIVLAGGNTARGDKIRERQTRTDANGIALVPLRSSGVWYVKFIRMRRMPAAASDSVDYESKWATLTFAVK